MAAQNELNDDEIVAEDDVPKSASEAKTGRDLQRLAGGNETEIDTNKAQLALSGLKAANEAELQAKLARERELAKVVVKDEDIALIVAELEVDKATAEAALREAGSDVVKALTALVSK